MHTETTLAVPDTEGTEAEAAEQAMSADAAEVAEHAAAVEPHAAMAETTDDHAHTDTTLERAADRGHRGGGRRTGDVRRCRRTGGRRTPQYAAGSFRPRCNVTEPHRMGHKVNPVGLRLGINRTWDSRWFAGADYSKLLHEDLKLRDHLRTKLRGAGVSRVVIERPAKKPRVTIYAARPGVVIGKKGQDIEVLKKDLGKMANAEVSLNIVEIRKPEIDAILIAENIAQQLERRVAFRRAMKRAVQSAMRLGALGIRINCGGRLGGAEIARVEWYAKVVCRCIRCAATWITAPQRPRPPTAPAA